MARRMGMQQGFSLDFRVPSPSGFIWDFSRRGARGRAKQLIRDIRPFVITGSPECMAFSTIQNLNARTDDGRRMLEDKVRHAMRHFMF